jgi:hypothetical protein
VHSLVLPDLHPVRGRRRSRDEHERSDDDVDVAVVVDVADVEGRVPRRTFLERVPLEDARPGLL